MFCRGGRHDRRGGWRARSGALVVVVVGAGTVVAVVAVVGVSIAISAGAHATATSDRAASATPTRLAMGAISALVLSRHAPIVAHRVLLDTVRPVAPPTGDGVDRPVEDLLLFDLQLTPEGEMVIALPPHGVDDIEWVRFPQLVHRYAIETNRTVPRAGLGSLDRGLS